MNIVWTVYEGRFGAQSLPRLIGRGVDREDGVVVISKQEAKVSYDRQEYSRFSPTPVFVQAVGGLARGARVEM